MLSAGLTASTRGSPLRQSHSTFFTKYMRSTQSNNQRLRDLLERSRPKSSTALTLLNRGRRSLSRTPHSGPGWQNRAAACGMRCPMRSRMTARQLSHMSFRVGIQRRIEALWCWRFLEIQLDSRTWTCAYLLLLFGCGAVRKGNPLN